MDVGTGRDAEPNHLSQAAGHQRSPGVQAQLQPIHHTRGNGHHVLQRPAQLRPNEISSGVDAERRRHEHPLEMSRDPRVTTGQQHRRRLVVAHFRRKAWPREHGHARSPGHGQEFVKNLRH